MADWDINKRKEILTKILDTTSNKKIRNIILDFSTATATSYQKIEIEPNKIRIKTGQKKEEHKRIDLYEENMEERKKIEGQIDSIYKQLKETPNPELIKKLNPLKDRLENVLRYFYLYKRVHESFQRKLLSNRPLKEKYETQKQFNSFVMVIDIRKSTDLLLNATQPQYFVNFLKELVDKLKIVIRKYYGIWDNFTGDGLISYFPDFYTSDDSGYYTCKAALECHTVFNDIYSKHQDNMFFQNIKA